MKLYFTGLTLILLALSINSMAHKKHNGTFAIKSLDSVVILTISMDLEHLSLAIEKESNCDIKNVISFCADQYIKSNVNFWIDGLSVCLDFQKVEIADNHITAIYHLLDAPIKFKELFIQNTCLNNLDEPYNHVFIIGETAPKIFKMDQNQLEHSVKL